ncbi:hypothetical protein PT974_05213 [Cladobotryum mycophilum]|uniref:F-box domain-containing protein n=1 Tax=Cladobotryum mycophilum TaxID=491253 RepID=A0ABR0SI38_9HYPO
MALFQASFSHSWTQHPAQVSSNGFTMDCLPSELVELICSWIHVDRKTTYKHVRRNLLVWNAWGIVTQFTQTLANIFLTSKKYREIALPYIYSHITVEEHDMTQLPLFVHVLCRNTALRPLVKDVDVRCLLNLIDLDPELIGAIFEDTANQFPLPPLGSWSCDKCPGNCSRRHGTCGHCIRLLSLLEITLDIGLLTTRGLFSLTAACKALVSCHFYSRGSNGLFPDAAYSKSLDYKPYREFIPEDIVPAFAHLVGTLKTLAINRWDGVRGNADHSIVLNSATEEYYATWPERIGNGRFMSSLKDFTTLETFKLDSTCLFHCLPPPLLADHLTARLPKARCHLTLPGTPSQMVPALHALAAAAAGTFPTLKPVEVTSDEGDVLKREMSLRLGYPQPKSLTGKYSRFVAIEDWDSLQQEFAAAVIRLLHIDSGNTDCFARDVLVKKGGYLRRREM